MLLSSGGTADIVATDFHPLAGRGRQRISIRWWLAQGQRISMVGVGCDSRSQPAPGFLDGLKSIPTKSAEPAALCMIGICLANVLVDIQARYRRADFLVTPAKADSGPTFPGVAEGSALERTFTRHQPAHFPNTILRDYC